MPARDNPQLGMDETVITNPVLEDALERRLRAADDVSEASAVKKAAQKDIDAQLVGVTFELGTALRVGRFRLTKSEVAARHVEFDAEATERISIAVVDGEQPTKAARAGKPAADTDADVRPTGDVNPDALRGEVERASEPTPIRKPTDSPQPPVN